MNGLRRLQEAVRKTEAMARPLRGDDEWLSSNMARKSDSWADLDKYKDYQVDLSQAPETALAFVQGLKKLTFDLPYPTSDIPASSYPQWFILVRDGGRKHYLVNTEGNTYARYAGRLVGMEKL